MGQSVREFIDHLLTTYGEKKDDMVKANLKALTGEFDCSGASIEQLYLRQDELQDFAVGTSGAITDEWWMLQTTPMSSNHPESSTKQYSSGKYKQLKDAGVTPILHDLVNEVSN